MMINTNPTYVDYPVQEFKNNPLICALNEPPINDNEAIKRLMKKPIFSIDERELPSHLRRFLPGRLSSGFVLPMGKHLDIMRGAYCQLFDGYVKSGNPSTPEGQKIIHGLATRPPATISFTTGLSGQGKTTALNTTFNTISAQAIKHKAYDGEPFTEFQIVYLKRNIPELCSARTLCKDFATQADQLLQMSEHEDSYKDASLDAKDYIEKLKGMIRNHHIGAIIIDDVQHLDIVKKDRKEELITLVVNLREFGVPIFLCGTYKAANILKGNMSSARRLIDGGFHDLKRPQSFKNKEWVAFCTLLWRYQWIQKPTAQIKGHFIKALYDYSQGITGIALNLFIFAQLRAIDSGKEVINLNLLKEVYNEELKPLHGALKALKKGGNLAMSVYDDLYFDAIEELKASSTMTNILAVLQSAADSHKPPGTEPIEKKVSTVGSKEKEVQPAPKINMAKEELLELVKK